MFTVWIFFAILIFVFCLLFDILENPKKSFLNLKIYEIPLFILLIAVVSLLWPLLFVLILVKILQRL